MYVIHYTIRINFLEKKNLMKKNENTFYKMPIFLNFLKTNFLFFLNSNLIYFIKNFLFLKWQFIKKILCLLMIFFFKN